MDDVGDSARGESTPLTWAVLLGQWMRFAQSALALPDDAAGRAWKRIVPDIIGLQAVAMALADAHQLPDDEQALAVDRSRVLIDKHRGNIETAFGGDVPHAMLTELIEDAEQAVRRLEQQRAAGEDPRRGSS